VTDTATKYIGTCKFFNDHYGFITPDDRAAHGGKEMFCHISAVGKAGLRELNEGGRVEYTGSRIRHLADDDLNAKTTSCSGA
jgi:cold shock protein